MEQMTEKPSKYEVWVFYDPLCGRPDWFLEGVCGTRDELADTLEKTMMYYHDDFERLDEFVKVVPKRYKKELKGLKPSKYLLDIRGDKAKLLDERMKKCKTCFMCEETDDEADENGRSQRICRAGKPWFAQEKECKYYGYDSILDDNASLYNPSEDMTEYIPLTKEEMEKETLASREKGKGK